MKKLTVEKMSIVNGGGWNHHTLKEHLICAGWGVLASALGPWGVASAMILCYASSGSEEPVGLL